MEGSDIQEDLRSRSRDLNHEVTPVRSFSPPSEGDVMQSATRESPDLGSPPGEKVARGASPRGLAPSTSEVGGLSSSLCAQVWQYVGTAWKEVYHFNNGLEFDCLSARPEVSQSRLHLPSTSLKALQRLRAALQNPKAIQLDICPGASRALVFNALYEHIVSMIDAMGDADISRSEIQRILASRGAGTLDDARSNSKANRDGLLDDDTTSVHSEVLVEPRDQTEVVDISICPLPECPTELPPIVALARLADPVSLQPASEDQSASPPVRFIALILCSARGKVCSAQLGREIGRAFAMSCMDEEFARVARTTGNAQEILDYLDFYLSELTLVPTVYMMSASPSSTPTEEMTAKFKMKGRLERDYMLTDSMVDGIERRLRKKRRLPSSAQEGKLHYCRHERGKHPWNKRRRYFVAVHERKEAAQVWSVTRRLWQGLGVHIDADTRVETTPQLPNVSELALDALKNIFRPECVGLDVASETVPKIMEDVLQLLAPAGLTKTNGADEIAVVLRQWFEVRQKQAEDSTECLAQDEMLDDKIQAEAEPKLYTPKLQQGSEQVPPQKGDEACHIIAIASSAVPQKQGIVGACVRFVSPLTTSSTLTGSQAGSLTRFLMVVVGPENARDELASLTEALGALTMDEDLMGDLTLAESGSDFCGAIDMWLADLTVVSHAYKQRKRSKADTPKQIKNISSLKAEASTAVPALALKQATMNSVRTSNKTSSTETMDELESEKTITCQKRTKWFVGKLQKYSIPLCTGVTMAMCWENIDSESYDDFIHATVWKDASMFGHDLHLHFIVNDIFMCFFFGLAMKEVAEALLPGGSLNPISRAVNPLFATAGGIFVPIAVYCVCILIFDATGSFESTECEIVADERRLAGGASSSGTGETEVCALSAIMKGWGVPTATDISLAWMFALLVFGAGHPCINFLLLLAIVDDAIGMIIIAVFYPNPEKPVEPVYLLLVLASVVVGYALRALHFHQWQVYIFIAGPLSWLGLIKAHVHPALALVCVVPIMPAKLNHRHKGPFERFCPCRRVRHTWKKMSSGGSASASIDDPTAAAIAAAYGDLSEEQRAKAVRRASDMMRSHHHAPLHAFEEALKLPVDLGMFFFGLANAGVQMGSVGGITVSVVAALFAGKTLGIAGFGLLAQCLGFPLPQGIGVADLFAASALGGVGLTVALFVANQAFVDSGLQGQAKMGAVISILCAALAWAIKRFCGRPEDDTCEIMECDLPDYEDVETTTVHAENGQGGQPLKPCSSPPDAPAEEGGEGDDFAVDELIEDILHTHYIKHEYERRGTQMPIEPERIRRRSMTERRMSRVSGGSLTAFRGSMRLSSKDLDLRPGRRTSRLFFGQQPSGNSDSWAWRSSTRSNSEQVARVASNGQVAQAWGPRSDARKGSAPPELGQNGEALGRESPTLLTLAEVGQSTSPPPAAPETKTVSSPRMLS